ncbi:MAG TPA: hypothetical protein VJL79_01280 [Nitrososphaera sp.]|nr:hypothetical protein [Nitrososphaera sp.]
MSKKKRRDDSYFAVDRRRKRKYMMIIIPVIIAVAAASIAGAILYQPPTAMAISGIECNRSEQLNYHIHSGLDVFVNGVQQQVPSNIGILSSPSCLYWLHTHSANGIIHIEAPETREFLLGQFIDVWEQTLTNSTAFFDSVSDMPVTAYVDGQRFEGDYRTIPLESLREIVLAYGTPPEDIPAEHDFGSITR